MRDPVFILFLFFQKKALKFLAIMKSIQNTTGNDREDKTHVNVGSSSFWVNGHRGSRFLASVIRHHTNISSSQVYRLKFLHRTCKTHQGAALAKTSTWMNLRWHREKKTKQAVIGSRKFMGASPSLVFNSSYVQNMAKWKGVPFPSTSRCVFLFEK